MSDIAKTAYEAKLEKKDLAGLKGFPKVVRDYYEDGAASQRTSKGVFTNVAKRFVTYLREERGMVIDDNPLHWLCITKRDVKDFIKSLQQRTLKDGTVKKVKYSTIKDYVIALNSFFNFLVEENYVKENLVPSIKELKKIVPVEEEQHHVVAMTREEVDKVKEHIIETSKYPKRDVCIFMIGCANGFRVRPLTFIDISDIDFKKKVMHVREKGGKGHDSKLGPDVIRAIKECIEERKEFGEITIPEDKDALFLRNHHGEVGRIGYNAVSYLLTKNTQMIDKHITPHKMRSTCITTTYQVTGDIYQAQIVANHEDVRTTARYIDSSEKEEKTANDVNSYLFG